MAVEFDGLIGLGGLDFGSKLEGCCCWEPRMDICIVTKHTA